MKHQAALLIILGLLCSQSDADQSDTPMLLHDPFASPFQKNHYSPAQQTTPWAPQLTSTLRAGNNSMVVISGKVVQLGETVDGYQLMEVHESSAVFEKNGQKIRLNLEKNDDVSAAY